MRFRKRSLWEDFKSNVPASLIVVFVGLVVLLLLASITAGVLKVTVRDTVTNVVVTDKERVTTGSGDTASSKYLIFTSNEVFENTDSLLLFKFNSSDVYGSIQRGQTCTFEVVGWRVPFLSWYRNIAKATCQ
jgi:hypothetical protein